MSHAALRQLSRVGLPARTAASSSCKLSLRHVTSSVWSHTNDATRARADEDRAWAWSPSCSQHPPPLSAQGRLRGASWPGVGSARAQLCQACAPEAETEATAAARTVLAIDPDMNGALVVLRYRRRTQYSSDAGAQNGASVDVAADFARCFETLGTELYDMPIASHYLASGKRKRRVDVAAMSAVLDSAARLARSRGTALEVAIERPTPIPEIDGWQSAALSAFTYGVVLGQLATKDLAAAPIAEVPAIQWKSRFALRGATKDDSRALAAALFPSRAADFKRKKDHGRAEAFLLAAWAAMHVDEHLERQAAVEAAAAARASSLRVGKGGRSRAPDAQHERLLQLQAS